MTALRSPSLFERPLRPDLAAFFAIRCCPASACARTPETAQVGVLAELARVGRPG